jgi:hypothetical protein
VFVSICDVCLPLCMPPALLILRPSFPGTICFQ